MRLRSRLGSCQEPIDNDVASAPDVSARAAASPPDAETPVSPRSSGDATSPSGRKTRKSLSDLGSASGRLEGYSRSCLEEGFGVGFQEGFGLICGFWQLQQPSSRLWPRLRQARSEGL